MFTPSVTLYIDRPNKRIRIVDSTALTGLNLSIVSVVGSGTITSPTGDVLATGLTINRSTGASTSAWVNLDVDGSGNIINGTYLLTYNYTFVGTALPVDLIDANGFTYDYTDLSNVLEAGDSVTIASSAITGNNGVKTVEGCIFSSQTAVLTVQTLTAEDPSPATFSFTKTTVGLVSNTYTWSDCIVATPTVVVSYDCDSTQFGLITFSDTTELPSGQTLSVREMIVAFPPLLTNPATPANQTTSLPSLTIDTLATGDWTSRLNYTVTGVQDDGLTYGYTATSGAQTTTVSCAGSLCGMTDCIQSLITKNNTALATTGQSAYLAAITEVSTLIGLANEQRRCGDMDLYRATVAQINGVLNDSGCDCGCCSDTQGNVWINNATFDGQNALDVLQAEIDALNLTVIPLLNQLAGDAAAMAAYEAILTQIISASSMISEQTANIGTIQALLNGLNPSSPSFSYDLFTLQGYTATLSDNLDSLFDLLTNIRAQITLFDTNYPSYTAYTELMNETLDQLFYQLSAAVNYVGALNLALSTLTPNTYPDDIAAIQSDVNNIYNSIAAMYDYMAFLTIQTQGIQESVSFLAQQVAANTAAIANLQQQTQITQTCFPIKSAVAISMSELSDYGFDAVAIPAVLFNTGCYLKISFSAGRSAPYTGANVISIVNVTTGESVGWITVDQETFLFGELIINLYPTTDNNFQTVQNLTKTDGAAVVSLYGNTNPLASDVFLENTNQVLAFSVTDDRIGNYFQNLEIVGYKSI